MAVEVLLGRRQDTERPDAIVCVLDASNLERNLYLVSQVLELGLPTVVALNMVDVAREKGVEVDAAELSRRLRIPVVPMQANRKVGVDGLKAALLEVIEREPSVPPSPFPRFSASRWICCKRRRRPKEAKSCRVIFWRGCCWTAAATSQPPIWQASTTGSWRPWPPRVSDWLQPACRYLPWKPHRVISGWGKLSTVSFLAVLRRLGWTDRIDRILTHKVAGTFVFGLAMLLMFQVVFLVAEPASQAIEWLSDFAVGLVDAYVPEGMLQSLLIHGVLEGVGGVLVFLPQILVLFLFIAILEDCGYMARAAYLMDRVMTRFGLSGKSFIPLLSSFACAIPGIMSARVIENRRDRLITILIAPLMSCSARLPVYTLLIGAFIPNRRWLGGVLGLQGIALLAMYALGIVAAMFVAWILRKTILRGETPPFIMELPAYKMPGPRIVLFRMVEPGWDFVRRRDADPGRDGAGVGCGLLSPQRQCRTRSARRREAVAFRRAGPSPAARCQPPRRSSFASKGDWPASMHTSMASSYQQLPGSRRSRVGTGGEAARVGLANRLRGRRLLSGPGSRDRHPGSDLQPRLRGG